jgi:pimeloyl-ACP methyl ester carboxylesterase
MYIKLKDTDINYVQYGNGKDIILLHGWGQNIHMMEPIGKQLMNDFRITIIDLPGFGESPEPPYGWTIYDYFEMLDELIIKLKINNPIIMGHSFGGRLAIVYASCRQTSKLILFASPFKKKITNESLKVKFLKFAKKIPIINKLENIAKHYIGSRDYKNASFIMRQVLVNTINEDLTECAKKITCPTLLIWGSEDTEVSVEDAKELESLIKDAGLIVYDGLTHYAYLENLGQTITVLDKFLSEDKEKK